MTVLVSISFTMHLVCLPLKSSMSLFRLSKPLFHFFLAEGIVLSRKNDLQKSKKVVSAKVVYSTVSPVRL